MPWYNNLIPESIKKGVCSCLIKRYLSHFIENEITRDQLSLDLYNGRATAESIILAVESLNELGEGQNWPIEFVDGYIDKIHISVPWKAIFSESTEVEIVGLKITIQPKQRSEDAASMFESMWNSMTSSLHLAEEFAKEEATKKAATFEGIELFAQTIDTVVRRIKVKLIDTVIQIEHLPKESEKGVGIVINVDLIDYYDDFSTDSSCSQDTLDPDQDGGKKAYLIDCFTTKNFVIKGIKLSTVEFSSEVRTMSRSLLREDSCESSEDEGSNTESVKADQNEDRHVILFGQCFNNQEVKVRLKGTENISGPKVAIELNLGSLVVFLSPRQFHILLELASGFSSPDMVDNSNVLHKNQPRPRPMTVKDYQRVEDELARMTSSRNWGGLNQLPGHGWATGALEESSDSLYIPMKQGTGGMYDSTMSGCSSSLESSITSSMVSSMTDNSSHGRRRPCNIDADPTAEISHFQVRIATLAVILLHEDLLADNKIVVKQMQSQAKTFFDKIDYNCLSGVVANGFDHVHQSLETAVQLNHLRLLAAPLKLEGNETTTSSAFSISGDLTASKLELSEWLYNGEFTRIPVLNFQTASSASGAKANLSLKFKHVQKTGRRLKNGPKTEISIHLDNCTVEFDLSIVDRISSLINHPPICGLTKQESPGYANQISEVKSTQDVKVVCPLFKFKVRFPIPDFRPATEMSKPPWWERNVRPDSLSLVLQSVNFHTVFQTGQSFSEYNIECKLLDIFYYESENSRGVHVAKSGSFDGRSGLTKLCMQFYPTKIDEDDIPIIDPMTHSCYGAFESQVNPESGPFSARKVVHQSDTPHSKDSRDQSQVIPGDKSELKEFVKLTTSNAQIVVELTLPIVSVQLESKHVYELIYNRINNDLLMWKSQAPKPNLGKNHLVQLDGLVGDEHYLVANSGLMYDSESDSDYDEDGSNVFYSTYDQKVKNSAKSFLVQRKSSQSGFVMSLSIQEGMVCMYPPVRDPSGNVIPGQLGEMLLNVSNANVFIVSGYKGDEDLGYVSVQVNKAQLYHCDILPTPCTNPPLKEVGAMLGSHLFKTIYESDPKSFPFAPTNGGDREMFSVALKIQANHETHHVKVVTVSLGLNKGTLRHKMENHTNSWISFLIDFFNVTDYPISGYIPKDVLTELHFHLWDSAIDYRPLYLPLRSIITLGGFSISSHITTLANTSTLTLIFEECRLFLSDKAPPRNGVPSNVQVDLVKDFVNVIEVTLFDISIKTSEQSVSNPHIDLRSSVDKLKIRTCSDSGRALLQLLTYYINDGDLPSQPEPAESTISSPTRAMEDELVRIERQEATVSKSQQEQVNALLQDAIEDDRKKDNGQGHSPSGAKLFFFPDEPEALENTPASSLPQVAAELGDVNAGNFGHNQCYNTDDEFVIIGEDDDYFPKNGAGYEISKIVDPKDFKMDLNSSKSTERRDVLLPPKGFPTPTARYTLCDMTVMWQMYGGQDFKCKDKKEVRFSGTQLSVVSFSNTKQGEVTFSHESAQKTKNLTWMEKGGSGRDHTVLMEWQLSKTRFSYEKYPESQAQSSRIVLAILDVEIRDRLAGSQIDKFLYQYYKFKLPRQSKPDMVLVKTLHSRPDPNLKQEECDLKIGLLPIRLNIDQDSLFFMIKFFKELSGESAEDGGSKEPAPKPHSPIMSVPSDNQQELTEQARQVVNDNLILLESRYQAKPEQAEESSGGGSVADGSPIYFRSVDFFREVQIRLDYIGKHVDMSHGPIAGLLMGLAYLKCSEIKLKRIYYQKGLLSLNRVVEHLLQEWISDIKTNQLPTILAGVGPMKAVTQLLYGILDLFWLPIEQYQKDGRIMRGLQRGANSFTTSTAIAALELTTRLIYYIQITAETAYDMLSPGPSINMKRLAKKKGRRKRHHQPQDIREGITNACSVVKEGLAETADNLMQVATHEKEQKGLIGVVGAVIREMPSTLIKPVPIALEATTNLFTGMQNQLIPDARREANEKWRSDS